MKIFRWRKKPNTGSHSFIYAGQKFNLQPGEIVVSTVESMGSASLEYEPLAEVVEGESKPYKGQHPYLAALNWLDEVEAEAGAEGGPEIIAVGGGWYNVINPDNPDKPLSDKNLRRSDAEELIVNLGGTLPPEDDGDSKRRRTRSK